MSPVTLKSGGTELTVRPHVGMVGISLQHRGTEVLALPGGLDGYRQGHVTGLPLLAPWANRLGAWQYTVDGVGVDLSGLDLHTDPHGLPIHGTMTAQPGWQVDERSDTTLTAHFNYDTPDLLVPFPFPHRLTLRLSVGEGSVTVETTLEATGDRAVPVAFGFHPYLALPGTRQECVLQLPARDHLEQDDGGLPTGGSQGEPAEAEPLGDRTFDDLYRLGDDRQLGIFGPDRAAVVSYGEGYPYAQVFAPDGSDFVCLEPMTAPTNALAAGGCPLVAPGGSFAADFSIAMEAPEP